MSESTRFYLDDLLKQINSIGDGEDLFLEFIDASSALINPITAAIVDQSRWHLVTRYTYSIAASEDTTEVLFFQVEVEEPAAENQQVGSTRAFEVTPVQKVSTVYERV